MDERLKILPDARWAVWRALLEERLAAAGTLISAATFGDLLDPMMHRILIDGFAQAGAHEGTVWLLDEHAENLVAAFNSGPRAEDIAGIFRQPLRAGMISLVFASGQPLCENAVYRNERQDKTLDAKLQLLTCAMLAVPFSFAGRERGVISCVRLKAADSEAADPPGFSNHDLETLQRTTALLSRLIDHRLMELTLGLADA